MPEYIGSVAIPEITTSGVFPLTLDWNSVSIIEPRVVVHQFGTQDAKVEQRYYVGPGQRHFRFSFGSLSHTEKDSLLAFFEARLGSYQPFTLNVIGPTSATETYTVRWVEPSISVEQLQEFTFSSSIDLVTIPSSTPTYTIASTESRFPGTTLKAALLSQTQEIIPLLRINGDIYLSDRRATVGGQLYQPRLLSADGISQGLDGASDAASFRLGNADRVFTLLTAATNLDAVDVEFSLYHVGSGIKLDLWKGHATGWSSDSGPEFVLSASDGLYQLRLPYPCQKISADDGITVGDQPVNVGGKKGISRITATSVINDTAYGKPVKDVWVNNGSNPLPVDCEIIAGRDESEFYAALGIVGRGPISGFSSDSLIPCTLDGQGHHGPGNLGLRRSYGGNPSTGSEAVTNNAPDNGSNSFTLDQVGATPTPTTLTGVSFLQIRRTDEKGIQPVRPQERKMVAQITGGLGGWTWTAPGSRSWRTSLTNPVWIAVNSLIRAKGKQADTAANQELLFDCTAAVAAAAICDTVAPPIFGSTDETQFEFTGVVAEEKPLRDWIREILGSCLGYSTSAFGKLKIGIRANSSTVEAFSIGNILFQSLKLSARTAEFNDLTVGFADAQRAYQQGTVHLRDTDHVAARGLRVANVNLVGVTRRTQAARIVTTKLRETMGGVSAAEQLAARTISFRTTVLALNTEPGMVCSMTHEDMPGGLGEFRVTGWRLNPDWSIDISGESTTDSMYDYLTGPKPADVVADPVPSRAPYDLIPGVLQVIGANAFTLGTVTNDGITAFIPVTYNPPSPLGSFRGVAAFYELSGRAGVIRVADILDYNGNDGGSGSARYGTGTISIPLPADSAQTCTLYLSSRSGVLTVPVDSVNTPKRTLSLPMASTGAPAAPPDVPTGLSFAIDDYGQEYGATWGWTPPSPIGSCVSYVRQYKFESWNGSAWVIDSDWGADLVAFPGTASQSSDGPWPKIAGTYRAYGRIASVNGDGVLSTWVTSAAQSITPYGVPPPPTGLTVTVDDYGQDYGATWGWTPPSPVGSCISYVRQYKFESWNGSAWVIDSDWGADLVAFPETQTQSVDGPWPKIDGTYRLYGRIASVNADGTLSSWVTSSAQTIAPYGAPPQPPAITLTLGYEDRSGVPYYRNLASIPSAVGGSSVSYSWQFRQLNVAVYVNSGSVDIDWFEFHNETDVTKLTATSGAWPIADAGKYAQVRLIPTNADGTPGTARESAIVAIGASPGIAVRVATGAAPATLAHHFAGPREDAAGIDSWYFWFSWTAETGTAARNTLIFVWQPTSPARASSTLGECLISSGGFDCPPRFYEGIPVTGSVLVYVVSVDGQMLLVYTAAGVTIGAGRAGNLQLGQAKPGTSELTGDLTLSRGAAYGQMGLTTGGFEASKTTAGVKSNVVIDSSGVSISQGTAGGNLVADANGIVLKKTTSGIVAQTEVNASGVQIKYGTTGGVVTVDSNGFSLVKGTNSLTATSSGVTIAQSGGGGTVTVDSAGVVVQKGSSSVTVAAAGVTIVNGILNSPTITVTNGSFTINMDPVNGMKITTSGRVTTLHSGFIDIIYGLTSATMAEASFAGYYSATGGGYFTAIWNSFNCSVNVGRTGDASVLIQSGSTTNSITSTRGGSFIEFSGADAYANMKAGYKVNGVWVVGARQSAIASPSGGSVIDVEARAAIDSIRAVLGTSGHGLTS